MKAALASVLAYRPSLIVLDEPFSGLDPLVRDELVESLMERGSETTIFLSSHDLPEIDSFASHIGHLEQGRLLFPDPMSTLTDRFRTIEVQLAPTSSDPAIPSDLPATWLCPQLHGPAFRFVDSQFSANTPIELAKRFPDARHSDHSHDTSHHFRRDREDRTAERPQLGQGNPLQMKQILHIFAKDVRLFYPEILISLALTFVFVQLYPPQWGAPAPAFRSITLGFPLATALVPISWWVLIARVIHAESMVGDRQFWITRPYRWPNLMASKALFIAAFVYVPFFVAQCALLKEAGFSPVDHLSGILFNLVMATGVLVLPIVAIATITSNFGKMSLAILILLIYVAMTAYLYTLLPTASAAVDYSDQLCFGLLVCTVATIIVVQYATRRTLLSRSLMAALAVTLGLFVLFVPG